MKIEFWMSGAEIQQLREAMDSLPLNPYGPVILKVLKALPMSCKECHELPVAIPLR